MEAHRAKPSFNWAWFTTAVPGGSPKSTGILLISYHTGNSLPSFEVGRALGSAVKVVMLSGREVLWIHTFHPRNFGQLNRQMDMQNGKSMGWERLANLVYDWIAESDKPHPAASQSVLKEVAHRRPGCKNTSVNSGATIKFPVEGREMTAIEMLQKLMVAQVKAHHALGAAIEELALWAENNGGSDVASNVRDALNGLDESSALIGDCLELIGKE